MIKTNAAATKDGMAHPVKVVRRDQHRLALRRTLSFLAVVVVVVCAALWALAVYINAQLHNTRIQNLAEAGSLYIEGFLSDHARDIVAGSLSGAEQLHELTETLNRVALGSELDALVIWDLQGQLLFASNRTHEENVSGTPEFTTAMAGKVSVKEVFGHDADVAHMVSPPYVEVFAPIRNDLSGEIIAIGEIYIDATGLLVEKQSAESTVWYGVLAVALGLIALTLFIAIQRFRLLKQLEAMRQLLVQNRRLKRVADQARISANQSNEELLNLLGAEIHDGPIQMLALLMLINDKDDATMQKSAGMSRHELTENIMLELRQISTGLILPEIKGLPLKDALLLAVSRHEELTGAKVNVAFSDLPRTVELPLAICLYRFIQEGLANANRHTASRSSETVTGYASADRIHLIVSDTGQAPDTVDRPAEPHRSLGLQGIRNRLAVFGGVVELKRNAHGGMDLALTVLATPNSVANRAIAGQIN